MKKLLICLVLALLLRVDLLAAMRTVAILPFANLSKNRSVRWIGETFPELLEDRIRWPGLNVLGREERLIAFERMGIPYSNVLSKASLIKIGQELDSTLLIWGDFSLDGSKLKVSASVLNLSNNTLSSELKEEGDLVDLQAICSQLAWQILKSLDSSFVLTREAFIARFPAIPNCPELRSWVVRVRPEQQILLSAGGQAYQFYKAILQLKIYRQEKDYSTSHWLQELSGWTGFL
jgi:TolB-like protein